MDEMPMKSAAALLRKYKNDCPKEIHGALNVAIRRLDPPSLDASFIIGEVERETGVSFSQMQMRCRRQDYAYARFICSWLICRYIGMTSTDVGKTFGRSHATVLHYNRTVDEWILYKYINPKWLRHINNLIDVIEKARDEISNRKDNE